MADALLKVALAGPHVSFQDGGRRGFLRYGVAASGPMDRKAFAIANAVLGKASGATAIEISPAGLTLDCIEGALTLALTGGGFIADLAGQRLGSWQVFDLQAGQRLTIRRGPWGSWCYLAPLGDLEVPEWLGSTATHGPTGLGGGLLKTGALISVRNAAPQPALARRIPCPVWARPRPVLHAVPGPQDRFFAPETLESLGQATFRLTPAYDRMGVRLSGPPLMPLSALSIPSEPILRGSVQVSGDGVATVLLADHQTTGGYPKIATILSDDLDGFVQCRPGDPVQLRLISADQALQMARQRARATEAYVRALQP